MSPLGERVILRWSLLRPMRCSVCFEPLDALNAMNLPAKRDASMYCKWLFTNDIANKIDCDLQKYFDELREYGDSLRVTGLTHPGIRQQAEMQYKEGVDGFKGAIERLDRTLAIVLIAIGWVATADSFTWYVFVLLLASAGILFCGRINVNSTVPVGFMNNLESHGELKNHEEYHDLMNFVDARQFEMARAANDMHVGWIQHRIGVGTTLFILGLISFGIARLL